MNAHENDDSICTYLLTRHTHDVSHRRTNIATTNSPSVIGSTHRQPRAKILRGPVNVTYSTDLTHPSWHLNPECGGLEKVKSERLGLREFPDAWALAIDTAGRICRMCTLESLLRTILRAEDKEPSRYVTFSSLPPAASRSSSSATNLATPSGEARLRRIAKTLRLETTSTPFSGVVAYGTVPARAVDALGVNLDTLSIPWVRRTPPSEHIQCFWLLAADRDRPLTTGGRRALWTTSRLLTR